MYFIYCTRTSLIKNMYFQHRMDHLHVHVHGTEYGVTIRNGMGPAMEWNEEQLSTTSNYIILALVLLQN